MRFSDFNFSAPRTHRLWCVGTWDPPLFHYPANGRENIWFWPNLVIFEHRNIFKIEKNEKNDKTVIALRALRIVFD